MITFFLFLTCTKIFEIYSAIVPRKKVFITNDNKINIVVVVKPAGQLVNPEIFMNSDSFYGDKIYSFITDKTYEIDTIDDFNYIEYILSKKNV